MVRQMSKKSLFRGHFDKQHGKRAHKLFKSASQHLYPLYWSLPRQLSWKESPFFTSQILGLLGDTLAANDKYPVLNRVNLKIPIQKQLSEKKKTFSELFFAFLKSRIDFEHIEKKDDCHRFCISKITDS